MPAIHRYWTWLVFAAGVAFSVYLQTHPRPGVFYSCDGGLKYIWTSQFARDGLGSLSLDLEKDTPQWVRQTWQDGLFPFEPPFVYPRDGKQYVNYQPFFCMASAPFYRALGWHGLYVLPIVSMWLLWIAHIRACTRQGIGPIVTAASLAALVFAAPLTFYSATFWEHVPALLLAMLSLYRLGDPSPRDSLASGALAAVPIALSAFMRPELLMTGVATAGLIWLFRSLPWTTRRKAGFTLTIAIGAAAWAGWNLVVTGGLLGFHGAQVNANIADRLNGSPRIIGLLVQLLLDTCPVSLFGLALAAFHFFRRPAAHAPAERIGVMLCLLLLLGLPLIFPNEGGMQWGPRYLLPWVPLLTWIAARQLNDITHRVARPFGAFLFIAAILFGAYVNSYLGPRHLADNYQFRILPLARFLHAQPIRVVMTNSQFISMELTDTFRDKWWFLANRPADAGRLADAMLANGQTRLLVLTQGPPIPSPVALPGRIGTVLLRLTPLTRGGPLGLYQGDLSPAP